MLSRFCVSAARTLGPSGLSVVALVSLLVAAPPAEAQTKGKCKNIPVDATFQPIGDLSNGGLFGTSNLNGTTYYNGVSGTVVLSVCDGTGDFYLNLSSANYFTYDFSKGLVAGDIPLLPTGTQLTGWVLKVLHVGNLARYVNEGGVLGGSSSGQLDTQMMSTLHRNPYLADYVLYCDSRTADCSGTRRTLANNYSDTSLIRVTVEASCSQWTIEPLPVSTVADGTYPVAGLLSRTSSKGNATLVSGGQYSMPFTITLTRANGVTGCAGLLQ